MTPTAVAILLLLALVVDYLSIGPNSLRDRLAFLLALPAVYEGFNGSPLDRWTVGLLSDGIDQLKDMGKGAYIAGAITSTVLGAGVGLLALYTVGALMPDRLSKRFGRFAAIKFPTSPMQRINYKLWACAFLLGMLSDLTHGAVGKTITWCVVLLDNIVAPFPRLAFRERVMHGIEYNIALVLPFLLFTGGVLLWDMFQDRRSSPTPPPADPPTEESQVSDLEPLSIYGETPVEEEPPARPAVSPTGVRGAWIRVKPRGPDAP